MRLDGGLAHIMAVSGVGSILTVPVRTLNCRAVKYWEIIANNLSKSGWSWGCVSALESISDAFKCDSACDRFPKGLRGSQRSYRDQ
jgi:hypothetical protein